MSRVQAANVSTVVGQCRQRIQRCCQVSLASWTHLSATGAIERFLRTISTPAHVAHAVAMSSATGDICRVETLRLSFPGRSLRHRNTERHT